MPETVTKTVTKDMTISDVIEKWPAAAEIMQSYGLHCFGCHVNVYETIEQGCMGHGMKEETINNIVKDINEVIKSGSDTDAADAPATDAAEKAEKESGLQMVDEKELHVTVTSKAAEKVKELMEKQGKEGSALRVAVVKGGCAGFSYNMDFEEEAKPDDKIVEVKGVKLFIDPASVEKLNNANIDYVESLQGAGFKIDNPNTDAGCGCGKSFS